MAAAVATPTRTRVQSVGVQPVAQLVPTVSPTTEPAAATPQRLTVGEAFRPRRTGAASPSTLSSSSTRLSSRLTDLIAAQSRGALLQVAHTSGAQLDGSRILVTLHANANQGDALAAAVGSAGGSISTRYGDWLDARLTAEQLTQVAQAGTLQSADLPMTIAPAAFQPVSTEGWPLINASAWRLANLTASGVKVGIIDAGFQGYTSLLNVHLPATVDTSCTQVSPLNGVTHGTAVSEIVHDIAPSAQLYFAAISTAVQMGAAEQCLVRAGVTVINMSLAFGYDGPGNGTGMTESVIDDAVAHNVFWANSAGNYAMAHWSGGLD